MYRNFPIFDFAKFLVMNPCGCVTMNEIEKTN